ncbi:MAG: sulfatase [Candidatus Rokubacteria bacterium]|nr:sulfatase [Candidatus Rokubacteria bacterium]
MANGTHGASRPDVVLLTIDCLRADRLGSAGYRRPTTPNLDRLAGRALSLRQAISCGPDTQASFPAIHTSSYPLMYCDPQGYDWVSARRTTLAEVLSRAGYATCGITANPFLSRVFGYDRGFDRFVDFQAAAGAGPEERLVGSIKRVVSPKRFGYAYLRRLRHMVQVFGGRRPYQPADLLIARALEWMRAAPRPFFLWIHFMDLHYPQLPRPASLRRFRPDGLRRTAHVALLSRLLDRSTELGPADAELVSNLYDAQIHFIDQQLEPLLSALGRSRAVVAVTSDHGELLGEKGRFGHGFTDLPEALLRVPMLLAHPDHKTARESASLVSLLDLAPTLASLAGAAPPDNWHGVSFARLLGDPAATVRTDAIAQRGLSRSFVCARRNTRWKFVANYDAGARALYDIVVDPAEARNLVEERPDVAREHELELRAHFQQHGELYALRLEQRGDLETRLKTGLETRGYTEEEERRMLEHLSDLGYVD